MLQLLGQNLFEVRKQEGGRLSLSCVAAIGMSTLDAIAGLHEQQYIHRDIKPANFGLFPLHASPDKGTVKRIASWALHLFMGSGALVGTLASVCCRAGGASRMWQNPLSGYF